MTEAAVQRLAIIGCGLMGGSFALALREGGLVGHVSGYSPRETTRERALALGVIDQACDSVADAVNDADVVLLAVPVQATEVTLRALAPHLSAHALLMDVGSTKGDVIEAAQHALGPKLGQFLPAHPIAGKEVAGIEHAESTLYQERRTILTQFLIEAAMICLLGGLIGLALAYPVTLVMDRFMPATLSAALVGMALLVSVATGVIAGFLPAWRAARMNPVDALRAE